MNNPGVVNVYSGLDGSGTLLASVNLALTPDGSGTPGCNGHDFCPVFPAGVSFAGTAMSVNFSGTANQIVYDDITLGSASVGGGSVPEPASLVIFGAGLAGLGAVRRRTAR